MHLVSLLVNEKVAVMRSGGAVGEVVEIFVANHPYYIQKMGDSTHFKMANSKEGVNMVSGSHIDQHKGEGYYNDVRSWLKGGASPSGKKYTSSYYGKGGGIGEKPYTLDVTYDTNGESKSETRWLMADSEENAKEKMFSFLTEKLKRKNVVVGNVREGSLVTKLNYAKGGVINGTYLDTIPDS